MVVWHDELLKAGLSCLSGAVVVSLGWFVGQRIAFRWNIRQKRHELRLSTLQEFYHSYGEFFAVWKLWNRLPAAGADHEGRAWELHKRATAAEAIVEGILVKLATETRLAEADARNLGCFRQAFQQLRQSIRKNTPLPWMSSDDLQYKSFKVYAIGVAHLLGKEWDDDRPTPDESRERLLAITANSFENDWVLKDATHPVLK